MSRSLGNKTPLKRVAFAEGTILRKRGLLIMAAIRNLSKD
jgi:hypothetical protein